MTKWAIIANEYPPKVGGVAEFLKLVAGELARRGDEVHLWLPEHSSAYRTDAGVAVHSLPNGFGLRGIARMGSEIDRLGDCRIFLQYVPNAFGWRGMNFPLCLWLLGRKRERVWVMFHEVAFPWGRGYSLKHNLLGAVTRMTAFLAARAAGRAFVSIPAWKALLGPLAPRALSIECLPIPSYAEATADARAAAGYRKEAAPEPASCLIGSYCTDFAYSEDQVARVLPQLLAADARRVALLVGRRSVDVAGRIVAGRPELRTRVRATGVVPLEEIAARLAACDVLVQPYRDGVSGRRTTAMAGLALGLPVVTNDGFLSEPVWRDSGAVVLVPAGDPAAMREAVEALLADPARRKALSARAAAFYAENFSLARTMDRLGVPAAPVP